MILFSSKKNKLVNNKLWLLINLSVKTSFLWFFVPKCHKGVWSGTNCWFNLLTKKGEDWHSCLKIDQCNLSLSYWRNNTMIQCILINSPSWVFHNKFTKYRLISRLLNLNEKPIEVPSLIHKIDLMTSDIKWLLEFSTIFQKT